MIWVAIGALALAVVAALLALTKAPRAGWEAVVAAVLVGLAR